MKLFSSENKLALFISFLSFFAFLSFVAVPAYATTPVDICPPGSGGFANLCLLANDPDAFGKIVRTVVQILFIAAVVVALFFLIWGGIQWIISGGDKGKVEAARNTIIAAIIGLVVAFLAYFVLTIIGNVFGINILNLQVPTFL